VNSRTPPDNAGHNEDRRKGELIQQHLTTDRSIMMHADAEARHAHPEAGFQQSLLLAMPISSGLSIVPLGNGGVIVISAR
jgi:hypothetical protein